MNIYMLKWNKKKTIVIVRRRKTGNKTLNKKGLKIYKNQSFQNRCSLTNGDSFINGGSANMKINIEKEKYF